MLQGESAYLETYSEKIGVGSPHLRTNILRLVLLLLKITSILNISLKVLSDLSLKNTC